jgi:hypothetical protein
VAKIITITDIRINSIRIERDNLNNVTVTADYQYMNANGVIEGINLQVNSEQKPLADFAPGVRDALISINDYVTARIIAAEGI